ncbi:hypothetical protein Tco_0180316 [Tanacetum coccineum]
MIQGYTHLLNPTAYKEREEMEGQDEREKKDREEGAECSMGLFRAVGQLIAGKLRSGSPYENRCPTSKISQKLGGMLMEFLHVAKFSLDAGQVSHSVVTKSWDLGKSVWANKILSYIKNLLGGVVGTVNVPGGVTMARFEDVKASWPAKHTGRITC